MTPKQQMMIDYLDGKITNVEIIEAWDRQREQNKRYRDALIYVLKTHLESYHDPKNMLEDIKSVVNGVLEGTE